MAGEDFYKVLGVSPAATADEIRSAYRELVKKYHPDLFSTSAEKSRATEKLLRINEAYAVLSDPARRAEYDEKRAAKPSRTSAPRPAAAPRASARQRASSPRRETRSAPRAVRQRWSGVLVSKWKKRPSGALRKWVVGPAAVAAVLCAAFIAYAIWEKPRTSVTWTVLAETVIEPPEGSSQSKTAPTRVASGSYSSRSDCTEALKLMVKRDEQEGSKAIFDERHGSIAITVQLRDETTPAERYRPGDAAQTPSLSGNQGSVDSGGSPNSLSNEAKEVVKSGLTRRVRSYECRIAQVLSSESWLRKTLRSLNIVS